MPDREKVINGLESCVISMTKCFFNRNEMCPYASVDVCHCEQELMRDALALLKEQQQQIWELQDQVEYLTDKQKEQEDREKKICKKICHFIRGSCSTDTYEDKDFVCHEIQKCFMEGR